MIRRLLVLVIVLAAIAAAAFWFLTAPRTLAAADLPDHTPDLANGEYMFWAGGCESCHAAPDATGDDQLKLGGGLALTTPFGVFNVPNISPDKETGIGSWSTLDFVNAMKQGIGKGGTHLYPAFPYASYQHMTLADVIDLKAFLDTLPPVKNLPPGHQLPFPFNVRRGIGLWQLLYVDGDTLQPDPEEDAELNRGAYLVKGPGHCGECHTPRNFLGAVDRDRAFAGTLDGPDGKKVPNITPEPKDGIGKWSASDITYMLKSGFLPDGDYVGGAMTDVVEESTGHLSDDDRAAIAAYLMSLKPLSGP
jgi:mono/diheme cytochrome c family protein